MPDVRAIDYAGSERLTMNMGPQHPSAHGVFRAILTLEGETVVGVDAVIGYLHRCHEKLAEHLAYVQYPTIASKTDYVAAMSSELAYVMAAERIGGIEVPKRAQYLRVLMGELQRLTNPRGPGGDEATIKERLTALQELESRSAAELRRAYDQIDEVLDVRQQARFRVVEEQLERRKLELLMRTRQNRLQQRKQQ